MCILYIVYKTYENERLVSITHPICHKQTCSLRKDLKKFYGMFSSYGKDSLLLAALADNIWQICDLGKRLDTRLITETR